MQFTITPAQVGTRPPVSLPTPQFLELLKEEGIRKLVSDHYDLLRQSNIKGLFPPTDEGFALAKEHSADFFIQICGGPKYFNEKRGAPMMAARHSPFKINQEARRIWLESYAMVLAPLQIPEEVKKSFWNYIDIFSIWMMNSMEN
ncbi:globin [Malaciobacter mytili]|uniref:Globin n=1 Tax=Malaciobacter mytili LMG 24559 TaxID=1032238 RepID=A0AAX2AIL6_9BACT|nr:globin [Malaciobacter mytili]AXH14637.1 globin [Malaciobacter mytili LMG 24559]RXI47443.1 globin [Malaciobacter mytili]RXK16688.1 globin [Malaciobacter mytili LMG 24559]